MSNASTCVRASDNNHEEVEERQMQNRYVGDVGDFGKYGLLRALCGISPESSPELPLGVVWYLVSRAEANNDGKHDGYLNLKDDTKREKGAKEYSDCDPALYVLLRGIRKQEKLSVTDLHNLGVFAADTAFFDEVLNFDGPWSGPRTKEKRIAHRRRWLDRALARTSISQVIFVDPDNGLEVTSTALHALDSPKFAFLEELQDFYCRSQSLVIYHHLGRQGGDHSAQVRSRARQLDQKLGTEFSTIALRYRRGTARAFFLKPCDRIHQQLLNERVKVMLNGPWGKNGHFDLIEIG